MVVYSFYIFDRHTECIYSKSWLSPELAAGNAGRPVSGSGSIAPSGSGSTTAAAAAAAAAAQTSTTRGGGRRGTTGATGTAMAPATTAAQRRGGRGGDDAKLIFGTVFSLRNMVRKLGGDDDAFISYRTAQYKLHYYETPSSLRLVMLTDTATLSMRNVLHQIYINLWVEYVVKNPLSPVEHKGGEGVKNELFELGLDQFIRGLM